MMFIMMNRCGSPDKKISLKLVFTLIFLSQLFINYTRKRMGC